MSSPKRRSVVSYDNLAPEYLTAFNEKYPKGYMDYMGDIFKVDKPDGSCFHAVTLEVEDAILMVKIKVKVDDREEMEKGLFADSVDADEETSEMPDDVDNYADADSVED